MTPELKLKCHSTYNNNGTINIFAVWQIPDVARSWLVETISIFEVLASVVDTNHASFASPGAYKTVEIGPDVSNALNCLCKSVMWISFKNLGTFQHYLFGWYF